MGVGAREETVERATSLNVERDQAEHERGGDERRLLHRRAHGERGPALPGVEQDHHEREGHRHRFREAREREEPEREGEPWPPL
jgi:hypothetical protein